MSKNKKPFDFKAPRLVHEFPAGELVTDMTIIETKKRWWSRRKKILYVATNKAFYSMEAK